ARPNADVGAATGVIVDATGVNFDPGFDARLVTGQGKEIYGPGQFDIKSGGDWLHWAKSDADAKAKTALIGDHPITVTAVSATGDDVVLNNDDAVHIFQANLQNGDFLSKGKVIFIVK
ncbi:MAG TPA: hypothetical protein VJ998_05630, partial [Pseudomonadales bacterium]|nr:hypothetical protein [Pseudomonadales bacterium]